MCKNYSDFRESTEKMMLLSFGDCFCAGWLLPAAVVGVFVFLYGVLTMSSNVVADETCQSGR